MLLLDQNTTEVCISSITYYLRIYVLNVNLWLYSCQMRFISWPNDDHLFIVQQGITQSTAEVFKMRI